MRPWPVARSWLLGPRASRYNGGDQRATVTASILESIQATSDRFRDPSIVTKLVDWLREELKQSHQTRLERRQGERIALTSIFVDIEASERMPAGPTRENGQPYSGIIAELLEREPIGLLEVHTRDCKQGVLLVAGPGQGKSTLTHYLAQRHRAAVLDAARDRLDVAELEILEALRGPPVAGPELPALAHACMPARIELPSLSTWMRRQRVDPDHAIIEYLRQKIGGAAGQGLGPAPEDMQPLLTCVPWLLIFDGLDEVTAAQDHEQVVAAIDAVRKQLSRWSATALLIATTRPQNYGDQLRESFESRYLLPLTRTQGLEYAQVLIQLFHAAEPERQRQAMAQLVLAYDDPTVARLLTTPLQLAIMAQLIDEIGEPPRQRWKLFSEYQNSLVNRERRRAADLFRDHGGAIEDVLRHVALLLQARGESGGDADSLLSDADLERIIIERLAREDFSEVKSRELAGQIRAVAVERLVFLVPSDTNSYRFELRSLQEFMAAKALTEGSERDVEARLRAIALSGAWRNVMLFAASRFASENSYLRDTLVNLCEWLNDEQQHPLSGMLLGGSELALAVLRDGGLSSPKYDNKLGVIALKLLQLPASADHVELVRVGGQVDELLKQEFEQRWPASAAEGGLGHWLVLTQLCERELPWALELAERHWPADSDERTKVIQVALRFGRFGDWLRSWMFKHSATLDPRYVWGVFGMFARVAHTPLNIAQLEDCLLLCLDGSTYEPLLNQLRSAPSVADAWRPLLAALPFIEMPTPVTLAGSLREIAQIFDDDLLHWWASRVPWPLGCLLAVAERPEQLREWADAVERQELGDESVWRDMEATWNERFDVAQYIRSLDEWPQIGAISNDEGLDLVFFAQTHWRQILEIIDVPRTKASAAARAMARLYACLSQLHSSPGQNIPATFDEILRDPEAMFALDFSEHHLSDVWTSLLEHFVADPTRIGILHALALYGWVHNIAAVARVIDVDQYTGQARTDAISILLFNADSVEAVEQLLPGPADESFNTFALVAGKPAFRDPDAQAQLYRIARRVFSNSSLHWLLQSFRERLRSSPSHLDQDARWYALNLGPPAPSSLASPPIDTAPASLPLAKTTITALRVENLRIFDRLDLELPPPIPNDAGRWLILLGENGVGKSTLLRAIVLALAEPEDAFQLVTGSRTPLLRNDQQLGAAIVELNGIEYRAEIAFEQGRERARSSSKNGPERPPLFAYGCARGSAASGEEAVPGDTTFDDVHTLFNDRARLTPARLWLTNLALDAKPSDSDREAKPGAKALFEAVRTTLSELLPGNPHIEVDGSGPHFFSPKIGERVPLSSLSDGYITTIGWVVDLLARYVRRATERGESLGPNFNREMTGLVIVDEIDLHLHPRWQRSIIADVRRVFPRMHFVVTTHNPLTLLSARPGEIIVLERASADESADAEPVRAVQRDLPPGIRADQVLTGEWFGLVSTRDNETLGLLDEHYRHLRDKIPVDDPERVRVTEELRKRLDHFPGTTLEQLVRSVAAELHDVLHPPVTTEQRDATRRRLKQMAQDRRQREEKPN